MKYSSAAAFRQALERRLGDRSRSGAESLVRLRKMVVFDRFLARLAAVGGKRWVLKGAVALEIRLGSGGRTTKDMDVVRRDDEESATADLIAAQATDLGDHFAFAVEKVVGPTNAETKATRYRVRAELAGRLFEEVMLDVGFSDPLRWQPDMLRGPDLLSFAEIEPAEVPALPLEQQVAEKVHAYTRTYGDGESSSRVKDLVDLILVLRSFPLQAQRLRTALEVTFESRREQSLPKVFPAPPHDWVVPFRKLAMEVGIDVNLENGYSTVAAFLSPVLAHQLEGRWEPNEASWRA